MVNYRANISALRNAGVERILATNAVGAINTDFEPGDAVVPHDLVDFTKLRPASFHEKAPVTHVDVSEPYCPEIRELLIENSRKHGLRVWDRAVFACTEGPRFETAAEIAMFRRLGCDIVGMTGFPEPVLARELEMCYAPICYVSNMAAGLQKQLTTAELSEVSKRILPIVEQVLIDTIKALPHKRGERCACPTALQTARFR
jgi:5'-methylthioadenosine phosphorylase